MSPLVVHTCDVLVVGAGASGAVVASRLSEDGARQVLLLEAGPVVPIDEAARRAMRNANQVAIAEGLNWKMRTSVRDESPAGGTWSYEAGKVVGGSSAVNAVQALRGMPRDYDDWALECGPEWSWRQVLPYFRAIENDPLGPNEVHGCAGPVPIRRERREELTRLQAGLLDACLAGGYAETEDHNHPDATGVGMIPKNVVDGLRMSAALTYLEQARARSNLRLIARAHVLWLLWNATGNCEGALVDIDGKVCRVHASQVVLCAGALNTPALLMRSGVGCPSMLEPFAIKVRHALPSVGQNLMDHPSVGIWGVPAPGVCEFGEPYHQTLLRTTLGETGHANDVHIRVLAGIDIRTVMPDRAGTDSTKAMAGMNVCLTNSWSCGSLRIASADPHAAPVVCLELLRDPRDSVLLMHGLRLAWQLLHRVRMRPLFDQLIGWSDSMMASDMVLRRAIGAYVRPAAHLCGSVRMGRSPDSGAAVDPQGRVFGVDNLWIADASVMPRAPSAPTHLTTLMVAEKIAAGIRRRHPR